MAKIAGVDVLLKVKKDGAFVVLGGQKGASLSRSANTIDVSDKNSQGWAESIVGLKTWSIECEGFVDLGDEALTVIHDCFDSRSKIEVEIRVGADGESTGYSYTGSAVITDFPEEFNQDDAVTYSLTLEGASPLVRTIGAGTGTYKAKK